MTSFQVTFASDSGKQSSIEEFQLKNKKQSACTRCRKLHRKCQLQDPDDLTCIRCVKAKADCVWEGASQTTGEKITPGGTGDGQLKRRYAPESSKNIEPQSTVEVNGVKRPRDEKSLLRDEKIYAKILESSRISSQFITSTQPLAPILSRDSLLSLDGEVLGLYCPWRDVYFEPRDRYGNKIDKELKAYLSKKGAFIVPQISEQRRLIQLFLDNLYPIYPVVPREILKNIQNEPLILLNALMLAGVRFDPTLKGTEYRVRAEEFRSRCALLQMVETNKVTLIQSFLLLSISEEGPEGSSSSREHISKAIMLILELGLHNLATSEQFDMMKIDNKDIKTVFRLNYDRNLMVRLFWTSYCCDRTNAATSCTAMLYNVDDMLIDEPFLKNFDAGEHQLEDYETFKRWYTLSLLFERVIKKVYRPPGKRTVHDTDLEQNLLSWGGNNLNANLHIQPKYKRFLKVAYSYCNLLYLRCKIGFLDLIEDNAGPTFHTSDSPMTKACMYYVSKYSNDVISTLSGFQDSTEHIMNIHALIHVLVLLHLEIECKRQVMLDENRDDSLKTEDMSATIESKEEQFEKCMGLLQEFKKKWWFSAASYYLFETLKEKGAPPPVAKFESIFIDQGNINSDQAPLFNPGLAQWF